MQKTAIRKALVKKQQNRKRKQNLAYQQQKKGQENRQGQLLQGKRGKKKKGLKR